MKKKTSILISIMILALCMPIVDAKAGNQLEKILNTAGQVKKGLDAIGIKKNPGKSPGNGQKGRKPTSKSEIEGVSVKVKKCYRDENDNVILVFTLLNERGTRAECQLRGGSSVVYDDEGNSYKEDRIKFSSPDGIFNEVWEADLPKDIAVKYRMKITDVDPDASVLKQVSIYMYELPIGSVTGKVHLFEVPITRPGD